MTLNVERLRRAALRLARLAPAMIAGSAGLTCGLAEEPQSGTAEEIIRRSIAQRLGPGVVTSAFPAQLTFEAETSGVVRGLRYVRGSYSGGADMVFYEDVLELNGRVTPLREIADWTKAVRDANWHARTEGEAITACSELVRLVVRRMGDDRGAIIYEDSMSLANPRATVLYGPQRALVQRIASAPAGRRDAAGRWTVRLWTLYGAWTAQYECEIGTSASAAGVTVVVVDSLDAHR